MVHFCDGLQEVNILNGVARLKFHRVEPTGRENEYQVAPEVTLAMPLSGLIEALGVLDGVRKQLIAGGLMKAANEPDNGPVRAVDKSPNFLREASQTD